MEMNNAIVHLALAPQRKEANHRSELVNQLLFGEQIEIIEKGNKWSLVSSKHDQYKGWMQNSSFVIINEKSAIQWDNFKFCAQVQAMATTEEGPMNIVMGSRLIDYANNVFKINDWVYHSYCEIFIDNPKSIIEKLISTAKLYLNAPYLWGGRSPFGIDCSGLTQMVFMLNGIQLPRDASQQELLGKKTPIGRAEAGDLAFFQNEEGLVIHVGLIYERKWDELKIIHSTDSDGKVRLDMLDKKGIFNKDKNVYTHTLYSIKRIVKDENI